MSHRQALDSWVYLSFSRVQKDVLAACSVHPPPHLSPQTQVPAMPQGPLRPRVCIFSPPGLAAAQGPFIAVVLAQVGVVGPAVLPRGTACTHPLLLQREGKVMDLRPN